FSSRRRHTRSKRDWSSDVCSSDLLDKFIDLISGIFAPALGILAATGMIKGLATILLTSGLITKASGTYVILYAIGDSFFYFLPRSEERRVGKECCIRV